MKTKVKLVHLLCRPQDAREIQSIASLSSLHLDYKQHINVPYKEMPPVNSCRRPQDVVNKVGKPGQLWAGHYGAWLAHKRAVEEEFAYDIDYFMVCECDCNLTVSGDEFLRQVEVAGNYIDKENISYISFGNGEKISLASGDYTIVKHIFKTHCIMFPQKISAYLKNCFKVSPWDNIDFWLNGVFSAYRMAITNKTYAIQVGQSLIDKKFKIH